MSIDAVISGVSSVICAVLVFYVQRSQAKRDKKSEKHFEQRRKENLLQLEMQQANGNLSRAVAQALEDGKINGNVARAIKEYDRACDKYNGFLRDIGISHIAA